MESVLFRIKILQLAVISFPTTHIARLVGISEILRAAYIDNKFSKNFYMTLEVKGDGVVLGTGETNNGS